MLIDLVPVVQQTHTPRTADMPATTRYDLACGHHFYLVGRHKQKSAVYCATCIETVVNVAQAAGKARQFPSHDDSL